MPTAADARSLLTDAFHAAVAAADPARALRGHLPDPPPGRLVVVGAGKAAAAMAAAVEEHYGPDRVEGLVITRYGHGRPTRAIEVVEAAHPVPDEAGLRATERVLATLEGLGEDDLALCLLSGGGSSLLVAPDGIDLEVKAALTRALLRSGAGIAEMNAVRKHLSRVKGGRLAAASAPARLVALVVSDVVGDDLSAIASGPTVPDPTTFRDALAVLEAYRVEAPAARAALEAGTRGERPETPKPGDARLARATTRLVATNQGALEAAAARLRAAGLPAHLLASAVTGEAREAARVHAAIVRQVRERAQPFAAPCALLSGGETTVTVRGGGRGGRNSEFALGFALELGDLAGVHLLAADTDGIDGSEDNAGAFVGPDLFDRLPRPRARAHLADNDAHGAFAAADALFVTGPTGTNVNDLRIALVLEGAG